MFLFNHPLLNQVFAPMMTSVATQKIMFPLVNLNQKQEHALPFNAHVTDGRGWWSNEDDAFLFTRLRKLSVF